MTHDRTSFIRPPPLGPGARVALVSPAGPLKGEEDVQRACSNVEGAGWIPVVGRNALARAGYFAGDDSLRLADLNAALRDDNIDAVWFLRGGYGAGRLLDAIDYSAIVKRPRALIGYSDITALHSAFAVQTGTVTYHGPTARAELTEFSRTSLLRAVAGSGDPLGAAPRARVLREGRKAGRLAGGNLSLLASLCGTPYAQSFDGAILVLEDINESIYRVDRMVRQLLMSGALRGCRAIVFGDCTGCSEESGDGARTLDEVLIEAASLLGVPCVAGVPCGHIADQWTIPFGMRAELDTTGPDPVLRLIND